MDLKTILLNDDIVDSINNNFDYLCELIPEIKKMVGFEHKHPHHHLDVWQHTLLALSLSEKNFDVRLCLLLHDIGKPFSYQEGEVRHFHGHALASAKLAQKILKRLNYQEEYIEKICFLIENHDTPFNESDVEKNYQLCSLLYQIQYCDGLAHRPDHLQKRKAILNKEKDLLNQRSEVKE